MGDAGGASAPDISLIVRHLILAEELDVLLLKSPQTVVLLLVSNVGFDLNDLRWMHG
jgi:hypothetical protein